MKQKSRFPEKFNKIEKSPARQIDKKKKKFTNSRNKTRSITTDNTKLNMIRTTLHK